MSSLTSFRFAGASADITPAWPVPLAGYLGRSAAFTAVASRLEANVVLLATDGARVLFVALDVLYAGPALCKAAHGCAARHGLPAECVVISASHSHFAPATDLDKPKLGVIDERWLGDIVARLVDLIDGVFCQPLQAALVESLSTVLPFNVNRRRRWRWPVLGREGLRLRPSIVMAPAPDEARDDSADLLRVSDAAGRPVAWLWKYACHPVGSPTPLSVDAEFPGCVRERLRALSDGRVPVVFWQGFAGDVRPWIIGWPTWRGRLATLRRGPDFGKPTPAAWQHWCNGLADRVAHAATSLPWAALAPTLEITAAAIPLDQLLDVKPRHLIDGKAMSIQRIGIGQAMDLLFISAEVCSPYLQLGRLGRRTVFVGYTGDTFGYLPSEAQVAQGGYEATGFFAAFGLHGGWRPGFQRRVEDMITTTSQIGSSSIG